MHSQQEIDVGIGGLENLTKESFGKGLLHTLGKNEKRKMKNSARNLNKRHKP